MEKLNEENLKELFEKFFDSKQAELAVNDVRKAEQILCEHPAPEPNEALIANIKAEIAKTLHKANSFKRAVYKAAVIAAVFILLATISVKLFEKGGSEHRKTVHASIIPNAIWESDNIAADDADLATLTAEIKQVESDMLTLQFGEIYVN